VNRARAEGRRVLAVGTTTTRALESAAQVDGRVRALEGDAGVYITPGYRFRVVDVADEFPPAGLVAPRARGSVCGP